MRAASVRVVPVWRPLLVLYPAAPQAFESPATGVGQNEDPLASVGRAGIRCAYSRPFRIEPEGGKVSEDLIESQSKVSCDILQHDDAGSHLANDSGDLRPQVARVPLASPEAGAGEWGAGVSRQDEIHSATPGSTVEGGKIRPCRRRIQGALFHARCQNLEGRCVPFHQTDSAGSQHPAGSEVETSDAGAETESPQGRIHISARSSH